MAAGNEMISAVPSTWTQSPKKPSVNTHKDARGSRRRFFVFTAVSRVLITTCPSESSAQVTGES